MVTEIVLTLTDLLALYVNTTDVACPAHFPFDELYAPSLLINCWPPVIAMFVITFPVGAEIVIFDCGSVL